MSQGSRERRAASGSALLLGLALCGCRGASPTPLATAAPGPATAPNLAGYTPPADVAPPPSALPRLPTDAAPATAPAPTPMLDAATRRAEAIQRALVSEPAAPPPAHRPSRIAPPDNLILAAHEAPLAPPGPIAPPAEPEPAPSPEPMPLNESAPAPLPVPALAPTPDPIPEPSAPADEPIASAPEQTAAADETQPAAPAAEDRDTNPAPEPITAEAELALTDLRLCRKVRGFGDVDPLDAAALRPGQVVLLYCAVAGLRYEPEGDGFRSRLAAVVEVTPAGGGEPIWTRPLGNADDLARERRREYFVSYRFALPDALPAGSYHLRLIQTDALADRAASRTIPFAVRR